MVLQKAKKTFRGEVVSNKMTKTIVVKVDRTVLHSKYEKRYTMSHRYKVHNEDKKVSVGDLVEFVECRPLSKDKKWRLVQVLKAVV